jgi:hypothetical protein
MSIETKPPQSTRDPIVTFGPESDLLAVGYLDLYCPVPRQMTNDELRWTVSDESFDGGAQGAIDDRQVSEGPEGGLEHVVSSLAVSAATFGKAVRTVVASMLQGMAVATVDAGRHRDTASCRQQVPNPLMTDPMLRPVLCSRTSLVLECAV